MVKYREIIRLSAGGISQRNIAYSCGCAQSTVLVVLRKAREVGLCWPLPEEMDDANIRAVLYPPRQSSSEKARIDHEHVEREMGKRRMTMTLLWSEYCECALASGQEPYQYTAFCSHHKQWALENKISMHIERRPGEQIQTDWAGDTIQVSDPDSSEPLKVYVFVASLPYSGYIFAEGFYRMDSEAWVTAHVHAFAWFNGTTPIITPDNCKTAITKNTISELIVNENYRRMAEYYGCAIVPARVRRPKDKAHVEMSVGIVGRQVIAALRNRVFFSLAELNEAIAERIEEINDRPFQKKEGSRTSVYLGQEKDSLAPLPPRPYEIIARKRVTVNFNYHVDFDGAYYSTPFSYVRREVEIAASKRTVSISCDGQRIAMHDRSYGRRGGYVTEPEHMPQAHRDFVEWDGERFRRWATKIGPSTHKVIDGILTSKTIEQQTYRSCHGVLSLAKRHTDDFLEEACTKALAYSSRPSYKTVKRIASNLLAEIEPDPDEHAYLRGAQHYIDFDIDNRKDS